MQKLLPRVEFNPIVINFNGYGKYLGVPVSSPLPSHDTLIIRNDTIQGNEQCTNIIYTTSGLHPGSLRHAHANVLYGDTLTMVIHADTIIFGEYKP